MVTSKFAAERCPRRSPVKQCCCEGKIAEPGTVGGTEEDGKGNAIRTMERWTLEWARRVGRRLAGGG